ncbi:hypothetical protein CJO75_20650 (plasmid) [Ralstonia solanacearum]|nr:hypothetical protein CJO75_20650 [Ralstonia solanacearum]
MARVDQLVPQETEIDVFPRHSGEMGAGAPAHWREGVLPGLDGLDRCCRVYSGIGVSIEADNSVRMFEVLQAYRVGAASSSQRVKVVRFLRIELARDPLVGWCIAVTPWPG